MLELCIVWYEESLYSFQRCFSARFYVEVFLFVGFCLAVARGRARKQCESARKGLFLGFWVNEFRIITFCFLETQQRDTRTFPSPGNATFKL